MTLEEAIAEQARLQKDLVDATGDLIEKMLALTTALENRVVVLEKTVLATKDYAVTVDESLDHHDERLIFLEGFPKEADLRVEALEKRVYKLEDVVNEILRRGAGNGRLVQTKDWQAHGQPVPQDRHSEGGAVETGDGVSVPSGGGETVKRNA